MCYNFWMHDHSSAGFGDAYGNEKGKRVYQLGHILQQLHARVGYFLIVVGMNYADRGALQEASMLEKCHDSCGH